MPGRTGPWSTPSPGTGSRRSSGAGSTGTVWLARREGPVDQVVAVKRVAAADPDAVDSLRREAEILATLDHPHVVDLLDLIDDPPGLALVMPLARGGSLRRLLDECGTLAAGQVVAVLAPIADALASAHRRGVVHGDVKPANLLFTSDGEPLLADFGVARHLGARAVPHLPLRGTAAYLDPALLDGAAPNGASDVYALGVVAYEALTGRRPHRGTRRRGARRRRRRVAPAPGLRCRRCPPTWRRSWTPCSPATRAAGQRQPSSPPGSGPRSSPVSVALPGPGGPPPRGGHRRGHPPVRAPTARAAAVAAVEPSLGGACAVAAVVAVLAVAGAWWVQREATSAVAGRACRRDRRRTTGPRGRGRRGARRSSARGERGRGHALPRADLDGDGCPDDSSWDGRLLVTWLSTDRGRRRAFRVGQVGDRVVLGDWDCDGMASPALYRPDTGEVLFASRLATEVGERVYAERVDRRARGGRPRRVALPGGCDEVRIGPTGRIGAVGR